MFYEKNKLAILIDDEMYRRTIHPGDLIFLDTFAAIINKPPYTSKIVADYMKKILPKQRFVLHAGRRLL